MQIPRDVNIVLGQALKAYAANLMDDLKGAANAVKADIRSDLRDVREAYEFCLGRGRLTERAWDALMTALRPWYNELWRKVKNYTNAREDVDAREELEKVRNAYAWMTVHGSRA